MVGVDLTFVKFLLDLAGKLGSFLGGVTPKRRAKTQLADLGIAYSEDSFLERVARGDREAVRLFLKAGMRADAQGEDERSALWFALDRQDAAMIMILARGGANLNATTFGSHDTALAWEASQGRLWHMRALLAAGAAVDARCADGGPALIHAAYPGGVDAVRILVEAGADLDATGHSGETALMLAARLGRMEELQVLIAAGANVNARDNNGVTALMKGGPRTARQLVDAGAEVDARDNDGRSVQEWFELWECRSEAERVFQELRALAGVRMQKILRASRHEKDSRR